MDTREMFVQRRIKDKGSRILEIGPLNRPIAKKNEFMNTHYCDIRSTEQVKALYAGNEYLQKTGIQIDVNTIVDIDFVLKDSYKDTFGHYDKFDYIIASHVLEHVEDLIGFLQDVATVLSEAGELLIVYPDKRYCFDHFRESASFRDAFDVFKRGKEQNARMALDFFLNVVHENNAMRYWEEDRIEELLPWGDIDGVEMNYKEILKHEKIDDVHYWPFTDRGFLKFLYDCHRFHLLNFCCVDFQRTLENEQQFMIALKLSPNVLKENSKELEALAQAIKKLPDEYFSKIDLDMIAKCNELELENQKLQLTIDELSKSELLLSNQVEADKLRLKALYNENKKLDQTISGIYDSNSWKITRPIRHIFDKFK